MMPSQAPGRRGDASPVTMGPSRSVAGGLTGTAAQFVRALREAGPGLGGDNVSANLNSGPGPGLPVGARAAPSATVTTPLCYASAGQGAGQAASAWRM